MNATPRRVVIVGGGVAGQRCAFALRQRGHDGSLALVSDEPSLPYDRPLLSKQYLEGLLDDTDLELDPGSRYDDQGIDVVLGARAKRLAPGGHIVLLDDGRDLPFDRLVVTTGGHARRPPSLNQDRVHVLRSLEDARRIRDALATCTRLVVVGGGVLGCEIAATATTMGVAVTVIEAGPNLMASALGAQVGRRITAMHVDRGVDVRTGVFAMASTPGPDGRPELRLSDGSTMSADMVVVGLGVSPASSWLGNSLDSRDGIATDETGRTNVPDVFAAGDCASWFHPRYGVRIRFEHWEMAAQQGVVVARSVLGEEGEAHAPLPYFWSNQYDLRLQWLGHAPAWDTVDIEDGSGETFVARYQDQGRLIAVLAAGMPHIISQAREELERTEQEEVA